RVSRRQNGTVSLYRGSPRSRAKLRPSRTWKETRPKNQQNGDRTRYKPRGCPEVVETAPVAYGCSLPRKVLSKCVFQLGVSIPSQSVRFLTLTIYCRLSGQKSETSSTV